jgi:hypothetical protein
MNPGDAPPPGPAPAPPDDELTRELNKAGIDITAEQHRKLTEAMRGMWSADIPVSYNDIVRAVRRG